MAQESDFTTAEEQAIQALVREYILSHPEIIPEAIAILQQREELARRIALDEAIVTNRQRIEYDGLSIVVGDPSSALTFVEYYDYRCPFCYENHPAIQRLVSENPDVRFVFKQFPVKDIPGEYPVSLLAAKMAMAAEMQGKFLTFHDTAFIAERPLRESDLLAIAEMAGIDMGRLLTDMDDPRIIESIRENLIMARNVGITGTPTFIIGGQIYEGLQSYQTLQQALDEAWSRTRTTAEAKVTGQE